MDVSIRIVVDNKVASGDTLFAEHGFSLWIESAGKRLLFDTGQGPALKKNARALGIDLATTDALVLSHGHYDHTGGVPHLLRQAPQLDVYCHPAVMNPRYAVGDGKTRSIGIPADASRALAELPDSRLHWIERPFALTPSVGLTGPVPRNTDYEDTGGSFYLDPDGARRDPIEDDQALYIQTDEGLVVCLGCAHAGVINTLQHIRDLTGEARLRAVIGGFHLLNATGDRVDQTIHALRELAPALLVPCHCTGDAAAGRLKDALGEQVQRGSAGMSFRF